MVLLFLFSAGRTILIIIGVFFLLRLVGRMMIAKRNVEEHNQVQHEREQMAQMNQKAAENYGKTSISKIGKTKKGAGDFVDFEEIKED